MMLGYIGSHRVGKTTLAQAYAEETGATLVKVSVSDMVSEIGHDSSLVYDVDTRIEIQEHILNCMGKKFAMHAGSNAVCDRTPLDAMLYMLSEVGQYTHNEAQSKWVSDYMSRCFDMTNRHFNVVLCVQPGIPLVECETSARANPAYIEHLNSLALGFVSDERLTIPHYYIPRHIVDLDRRVQVSKRAVQRALIAAAAERAEAAVLH